MTYKDNIIDYGIIREFSSQVPEENLIWHTDNEDRYIEVVGETNWKVQLDNELPKNIDQVYIPKGVFHRLIKGDGDLKIKITKL